MGYTYWCAACGNPDIIVEETKEGYSVKKGLAGAVLLGPVGAVAGLDGKKIDSFYCPKCGARLSNPMPDYEVNSILDMIKSPNTFRRMLEQKRKKYPNMLWPRELELSTGDIEKSGSVKSATTSAAATFTSGQTRGSGDIKKDLRDYLNQVNVPLNARDIEEHFLTLSYASSDIIEAVLEMVQEGLIKHAEGYFVLVRDIDEMIQLKSRGKELRESVEKTLEIAKAKHDEEKKRQQNKRNQEINKQAKSMLIERAQKELSNINIVLFNATAKLEQTTEQHKSAKEQRESSIAEKKSKLERQIQELSSVRDDLSIQHQQSQKREAEYKKEIDGLSFIHRGKKKELEFSLQAQRDITEQLRKELSTLNGRLDELGTQGEAIVSKTDEEIAEYYMEMDKAKREVESLEARKSELEKSIKRAEEGTVSEHELDKIKNDILKREKETATMKRNRELCEKIEEILSGSGETLSIVQLMERDSVLSQETPQKIAALIRICVDNNIVEKTIVDGKSCYRYAGGIQRGTQKVESLGRDAQWLIDNGFVFLSDKQRKAFVFELKKWIKSVEDTGVSREECLEVLLDLKEETNRDLANGKVRDMNTGIAKEVY